MDAVSFREMALEDLLDAFASTDPVPGGGSAAALAGAVGTSLLLMVAGIPKTKTGAPEETADLAEASSRLHPLRDQLLELVDRDSNAYTQVMDALKLPKTSDAEKAARKQAIDAATRAATETPLDTMRACQQALRGAVIVASNGNRRTTSDVGVGVELLLAALRGKQFDRLRVGGGCDRARSVSPHIHIVVIERNLQLLRLRHDVVLDVIGRGVRAERHQFLHCILQLVVPGRSETCAYHGVDQRDRDEQLDDGLHESGCRVQKDPAYLLLFGAYPSNP